MKNTNETSIVLVEWLRLNPKIQLKTKLVQINTDQHPSVAKILDEAMLNGIEIGTHTTNYVQSRYYVKLHKVGELIISTACVNQYGSIWENDDDTVIYNDNDYQKVVNICFPEELSTSIYLRKALWLTTMSFHEHDADELTARMANTLKSIGGYRLTGEHTIDILTKSVNYLDDNMYNAATMLMQEYASKMVQYFKQQ